MMRLSLLACLFSLVDQVLAALTCFDSSSAFPETTAVCKTGQVCYSEYYALTTPSSSFVTQHFDRFCVFAEACEYRGIRLPPSHADTTPATRPVEWIASSSSSPSPPSTLSSKHSHRKHKPSKVDLSNRVQVLTTPPPPLSTGCRSLDSLDASIQQTFLKDKHLLHSNKSILHTRFCCCASHLCNDADATGMSALFGVATQTPPAHASKHVASLPPSLLLLLLPLLVEGRR